MSDSLPTVWPIEPHTLAKHAILKKYLDAWFPILTKQADKIGRRGKSARVLYVDGFAGPGVYKNGEPGSPIIAIDAAINHSLAFPFPVEMLFIEERADRFEKLTESVSSKSAQLSKARNVHVVNLEKGDCDQVLGSMLARCHADGLDFGPALAFLDQFGYGAVSMDLLRQILAVPQCEVFTYLDYKDINRFITDPHKAPALTRAFGGTEWQQCIALPERERRSQLLELYKQALRTRGRATYVSSFLMCDDQSKPLYWLMFGTNNIRGLEEMKKAMWSVDRSGNFRFSDEDVPGQLRLLNDTYDQEWLALELCRRLVGRTMTVDKVFEFVLTDTPCYKYIDALRLMENDGSLSVVSSPESRRKGQFGEDRELITVRFGPRKPSQKSLW